MSNPASSLGLSGFRRSKRYHKLAWCSFVLVSLWAFHIVFKQDGKPGSVFTSIGKTVGSLSTEISESIPWSTVTSKLKDWTWENDHGANDFDALDGQKTTQDEQYEKRPLKIPPKGQTRPKVEVKPQDKLQPESHTLTSFTQIWLENEIGGPLTNNTLAPISSLCASVSWHDDIVLNLSNLGGGVGNLRVAILDFIYFAMQTGSHIILPSYIKRKEKTLYWLDESNGYHTFSHLFDSEFLISTLSSACPQMRVFRSTEEAKIIGRVKDRFDMGRLRTDKVADTNPSAKIAELRDWVDTKPKGYLEKEVNMVTVSVPLIAHDMRTMPKMRVALGRLIKYNHKIRELAATALFNLRRKRQLEVAIDPSKQIYHGAYYGSAYCLTQLRMAAYTDLTRTIYSASTNGG